MKFTAKEVRWLTKLEMNECLKAKQIMPFEPEESYERSADNALIMSAKLREKMVGWQRKHRGVRRLAGTLMRHYGKDYVLEEIFSKINALGWEMLLGTIIAVEKKLSTLGPAAAKPEISSYIKGDGYLKEVLAKIEQRRIAREEAYRVRMQEIKQRTEQEKQRAEQIAQENVRLRQLLAARGIRETGDPSPSFSHRHSSPTLLSSAVATSQTKKRQLAPQPVSLAAGHAAQERPEKKARTAITTVQPSSEESATEAEPTSPPSSPGLGTGLS